MKGKMHMHVFERNINNALMQNERNLDMQIKI